MNKSKSRRAQRDKLARERLLERMYRKGLKQIKKNSSVTVVGGGSLFKTVKGKGDE
jgi:hypothetical protein